MQAGRIDVLVRPEQPDPAGASAGRALQAAGLDAVTGVRSRRGYLLGAELSESQVREFARAVLCDPVVDTFVVHAPCASDPLPTPVVRTTVSPKPCGHNLATFSLAKAGRAYCRGKAIPPTAFPPSPNFAA